MPLGLFLLLHAIDINLKHTVICVTGGFLAYLAERGGWAYLVS